MPSAELIRKRKELEAKQDKLGQIFKEAGDELDMTKVKCIEGDDAAKVAEIRKMNAELTDLRKSVDDLVEVENAKKALKTLNDESKQAQGIPQPTQKGAEEEIDIGKMFTDSDAYKGYMKDKTKGTSTLNIPMKTAFTTSAGWAPQSIRTGIVIPYATRPIRIVDIVPGAKTNMAAVLFMEETTFTNAAAEVTEANSMASEEAALALTERSVTVRKVPVWIPVTTEQLEDVEGIQSYLQNRLGFMIRQRLDLQMLTGDGVAPNMTGILNKSGIQTFSRAGGDVFDVIYTAIKNVRTIAFADPNAIVMHPNDFQQVRLMRTDSGLYILGNPNDPGVTRIWGLPVVESTAETENSVVVGDFANFCALYEKKGIDIQISDSHDTYFIYGKLAIRAEVRVAFVMYRPAAFCVITNF